MKSRFERIGMGYRFAPTETSLVLDFERVHNRDDDIGAHVRIRNSRGELVMTRRVNLMASLVRGSMADLVKELASLNGDKTLWEGLLREAAESVMASHTRGRPVQRVEGVVKRPPAPASLCQGLLLKNKPNCWLGAASTGKSTLAKAMCAYYAVGMRFCDRPMEQGVPLYLDWEDDRDSFVRTVYDVCQNLGVQSLPPMLWRDMHGMRLRDQLESLTHDIDEYHVGLVVLDAVAAAGGSTGEHMSWEAVALEMEECLGGLPPVTVLALDHVTGAEHRAQRGGGPRPPVPIKARGAERKLEYFRNQWTLVTDVEAESQGRHVIEWTHTKNNFGVREKPFATEIIHRESEISVVLRPMRTPEPEPGALEQSAFLAALALATDQRPSEVAWRLDGKPPDPKRIESVRRMLDREVERGNAIKRGRPIRYSVKPDSLGPEGLLIPFPGGAS